MDAVYIERNSLLLKKNTAKHSTVNMAERTFNMPERSKSERTFNNAVTLDGN
jgi:hypothetical protein